MLSTKAFMDAGPHLRHVTNSTGHTQGTLILGEHCLHLYVAKGLGENFTKKFMSKTCLYYAFNVDTLIACTYENMLYLLYFIILFHA